MPTSNGRVAIGVAGGALIAGFFLPWIDVGGAFRISGYDMVSNAHQYGEMWNTPVLMMLFVPIGGLAMLVTSLLNLRWMRLASVATGLGIVGYASFKAMEAFFKLSGWGLWIVFAAALAAIVMPLLMRMRTRR